MGISYLRLHRPAAPRCPSCPQPGLRVYKHRANSSTRCLLEAPLDAQRGAELGLPPYAGPRRVAAHSVQHRLHLQPGSLGWGGNAELTGHPRPPGPCPASPAAAGVTLMQMVAGA